MATRKAAAQDNPIPDYWMICREPAGGYAEHPNPKKLYLSEAAARHDAEHLCRQDGRRFFLLQVVDVVETTSPPVAWASKS